jgi:Protein of unknown function (DUF1761)
MLIAIVAATLAAFVISATYYSIVPGVSPADGATDRPPPAAATQAIIELIRSAAIASLVAGLVHSAEWGSVGEGALLGLALWTMPVVLLIGSVVHEGTPIRVAATHAGDWLIKLVAVGAITGILA